MDHVFGEHTDLLTEMHNLLSGLFACSERTLSPSAKASEFCGGDSNRCHCFMEAILGFTD
jgi:hypothetical protein